MTNETIHESFYDNDYFHYMENRYWSGAHEERVIDVMSILPPPGKGREIVLDYGCGSGYFSYQLLKSGYQVDAWDYSAAARKFVESHYLYVNALINDPVTITSGVPNYDGVLLLDVIEHIAHRDQDSFLRALSGRMKLGSWLLVSTDNQTSFFFSRLGSLIQKIDMRISESGRAYRFIKRMEQARPYYRRYQDSHIGLLSRDEIIKKFASIGGFRLEKERHGFFFNSLFSRLVSRIFRLKPLHSAYLFRKIS